MTRMPLAERREQLIEAAIAVISDHGVAAATTRAIAARAQMPLASFHYAFESHGALMAEVMKRVLQDDAEHFKSIMAPTTSVVKTVEYGLNDYIDSLVADKSRQQAVMELTFYALRTEDQQHVASEGLQAGRDVVQGLMAAYAEAAGINFTVDPSVLAAHLLVITDGLTVAYLSNGDADSLRALVPGLAATFGSYVAD